MDYKLNIASTLYKNNIYPNIFGILHDISFNYINTILYF